MTLCCWQLFFINDLDKGINDIHEECQMIPSWEGRLIHNVIEARSNKILTGEDDGLNLIRLNLIRINLKLGYKSQLHKYKIGEG